MVVRYFLGKSQLKGNRVKDENYHLTSNVSSAPAPSCLLPVTASCPRGQLLFQRTSESQIMIQIRALFTPESRAGLSSQFCVLWYSKISSVGFIERANRVPEIQMKMKQNYWSEAKWSLQGRRRFLSSVRRESELGKILLDKSAQVPADLRARGVTSRQCRFWFRVSSARHSYSASEIKIIKHLLPAEVYLHE